MFLKAGNRKIEKNFLKKLKSLVDNECKPIVITDAGFHNYWFKEVLKLGWDYIGRIRGKKKCCFVGNKTFIGCKTLFKVATKEAKFLGKFILTEKNPLESYFYIIRGKLTGRKALTKSGKIKKDKDSKNYGRAHREPWLLASSLHGEFAAKKVTRMYGLRMRIEEAFRDLKSSRYGLGLEEGKTKKSLRRDILLLIGMLASLVAWITGKAAEQLKLHYQFQSNSIKHRRVISLFYLGCQIIRKKIMIAMPEIRKAIASIRKEVIYD